MERTCVRAVEMGLPAIAFTEHADFGARTVPAGALDAVLGTPATSDGVVTPPELDVSGYLECLHQCRDRFPGLRIISGVELGEPHRHGRAAGKMLDSGDFDRVLGSLHSIQSPPGGRRFVDTSHLYGERPAAQVVRDYLAELLHLIEGSDVFAVLAHIDYPARFWPAAAGPYVPEVFEDEFRSVLRTLAHTGRALEVNTTVPLHPRIVHWWYQEGGEAVTFGSDAHDPATLAHGFSDAAAMVEAHGFRPGHHPYDLWTRSG